MHSIGKALMQKRGAMQPPETVKKPEPAQQPDATDTAKSKHNAMQNIDGQTYAGESLVLKIRAHRKPIYAIAFTKDTLRFFTGGKDRTIKCWRVSDGKLLATLEGHTDSIYGLVVSDCGTRLYSGSRDMTIKTWAINDGSELRTSQLKEFEKNHFNIMQAQQYIEVSDRYGLSALTGVVYGMRLTPDGTAVYSGEARGTVTEWNSESGKVTNTFVGHHGPVGAILLSPDQRFIYSGSGDCNIKIWPVYEKSKPVAIATLEGHSGPVLAMDLMDDGRRLFSASADMSIKAWHIRFIASEVRGGECIFTVKGHCSNQVRALALLSGRKQNDGGVLFSAGEDNQIKGWGAQRGNWITTLRGHNDWVNCLQLSSDKKWMLSAGHDGHAILWDIGKIIDPEKDYSLGANKW